MLYRIHFSCNIISNRFIFIPLIIIGTKTRCAERLEFRFDKYFSKLDTGHILLPVAYILSPSLSSSFVVPWWFFVCSDFTFVIYFLATFYLNLILNTYTGTPDIVYNSYLCFIEFIFHVTL
jgi:hypothetical protein